MFTSHKQLRTGIYRTDDPVENVRFRVTIKKIHSLIEIPRLDTLDGGGGDAEDTLDTTGVKAEECRELGWQEKIFSRYEIDYYRVRENCKTDVQKRYHAAVKVATEQPQPSGALFTYTEQDEYYSDDDMPPVGGNVAQSRRFPDRDTVQRMHVMADLGSEVVLFTLKWCPEERLLLVYPDFNCISVNPHYKEVRESSLQMYHYALERLNLSPAEDGAASTAVIALENQLWSRMQKKMQQRKPFQMPKHLHTNCLMLLEIVSGERFAYDGAHVRYRMVAPDEVKLLEGTLDGSTHAASQTNGLWNYGHCHEMLLSVPESNHLPGSITVYLEVICIDGWGRERLLGSTSLQISLESRAGERTANIVRHIKAGGLYDKLEAYLVGNRRQINLEAFYGKDDQKILNRYGSRTECGGRLTVRYQILRQHQPKLINDVIYRQPAAARKGFKNASLTLGELIASYHRARERLEELVELNY